MSNPEDIEKRMSRAVQSIAQPAGHFLTETFHMIGLFAIGAATVWAGAVFFIELMGKGRASIEDLLLLFIYLEIGSMVGIYFRTNHMPLRFLIYIGITALTRHLIGWVNHEPKPDMGVVILAGAILILALSVLVIRYASYKFPSGPLTQDRGDLTDTDPGVKN
ncbi:MAG: phosphate-starvation-inducible PsiE family protein [Hyphomicrobiaceae bacterium]|nr:phosphate-starvation-inducible PsiE family protein [Hyphomicrobiaceae bacterium]